MLIFPILWVNTSKPIPNYKNKRNATPFVNLIKWTLVIEQAEIPSAATALLAGDTIHYFYQLLSRQVAQWLTHPHIKKTVAGPIPASLVILGYYKIVFHLALLFNLISHKCKIIM